MTTKPAPTTAACLLASRYGTDRFTWNKDTSTFSASASDLNWAPGSFARHIELKSQWTGKVRVFSGTGIERSGDEVLGWKFSTLDGRLHIVVFND